MARYRNSFSYFQGLNKTRGVIKYSFNYSKALSQSSIHCIDLHYFKDLKKGWHLSVALEIKWLNVATFFTNCWVSLTFRGGFMLRIALIFFEFASIPHWFTINPKNVLRRYTKNTFLWVPLHVVCRSMSKFYLRWITWSITVSNLVNMSSTYTSMVRPIWLQKNFFTNRWYVAPTFFNLNGITL